MHRMGDQPRLPQYFLMLVFLPYTWPPHLPCTQEPMTVQAALILAFLTWELCLFPEESICEALKKA